ncbi:MAG TPA: thiamine ABC transporter substrate-binding protein, partial [bacterium]|nr:thiamine ABC transporter substrate-binding protein [bacterium]
MMKLHVMGIITVIALLLAAGCTADKQETSTEVEIQTLTVMTHDSFDVSADLVAQFEREHQAKIEFLQSGDAGQVLNTAVLQKANPLADVLYGVDNSFLGRALAEGIFQPYVSGETAAIREEIREYYRDERVTPIDYGDVCLNYDKAVVSSESLPSLESLGDPAHKDQLVVMNPATSSPGLSFLLLTVGYFGEDGYLAYWQSLKDNGVKITSGWEDAYWGEFSAASEGERPIVVSYATSPAAEVYFSEGAL